MNSDERFGVYCTFWDDFYFPISFAVIVGLEQFAHFIWILFCHKKARLNGSGTFMGVNAQVIQDHSGFKKVWSHYVDLKDDNYPSTRLLIFGFMTWYQLMMGLEYGLRSRFKKWFQSTNLIFCFSCKQYFVCGTWFKFNIIISQMEIQENLMLIISKTLHIISLERYPLLLSVNG